MNELLTLLNAASYAPGEPADLPELRLQAVSTRSGSELLPSLADAIDRACGWVLHRQMSGAATLQMRVETQGRSLMQLYAALMEQGLELSRDSHLLLTERCSCAHLHRGIRSSIVALNLSVKLPAEPALLGQWWNLSAVQS